MFRIIWINLPTRHHNSIIRIYLIDDFFAQRKCVDLNFLINYFHLIDIQWTKPFYERKLNWLFLLNWMKAELEWHARFILFTWTSIFITCFFLFRWFYLLIGSSNEFPLLINCVQFSVWKTMTIENFSSKLTCTPRYVCSHQWQKIAPSEVWITCAKFNLISELIWFLFVIKC